MIASTEKLRVAIAGLGAVTHDLHLPACQAAKHAVEIVGGCDPSADARARFSPAASFAELQPMLVQTQPDLVIVATPPAGHLDACLQSIDHGCHVFCEKPFTESLDDADRIIAASESNDVYVAINNQFRYMNIHRAAFDAIGTREFGELRFVLATQTFRPTESTEQGWRGKNNRRTCFEFGIHVLDLLRYLFGSEPDWIFASMPRRTSNDSDLLNTIHLDFGAGRAASVVLDRWSRGSEHYLSLRLDGERADVCTSIGGKASIELGLNTKTRRPYARWGLVFGGEAKMHVGDHARTLAKDSFNPMRTATKLLFGKVVEALRRNERPPNCATDNRKSLALVMAAYESAKTQRPVVPGR